MCAQENGEITGYAGELACIACRAPYVRPVDRLQVAPPAAQREGDLDLDADVVYPPLCLVPDNTDYDHW